MLQSVGMSLRGGTYVGRDLQLIMMQWSCDADVTAPQLTQAALHLVQLIQLV